MNKLSVTLALVILLGVGGFFFLSNRSSAPPSTPQTSKAPTEEITEQQFANPKKSAHYENNTPEHGSTLAGVPINAVLDFNFDLVPPSSISITKDGQEYGVGETVIDANKLSMRKSMDPSSPDGLYKVTYQACWPDKTCHDGNFQFKIDRRKSQQFEDMRNQKDILVTLSQIKFHPPNLRISSGTKITWVNDDEVEHFVNTDPHPAHTYLLTQNSKALKKGDKYTYTFDKAGIYPYHCSAHAASMMGSILVD